MKIKCPTCSYENIEGTDRCAECLHSLMQRDLPSPKSNDSLQKAMMTAPVSALLTGKDLLVADISDPIEKIIRIFQKKQKNCVLVYKQKKIVGIISNRDLLRKVAGQGQNLSEVTVESVMTKNPEVVTAEDPIAFAINKMGMGGFRHVPVLAEDGTPISIISIHDVLHYLSSGHK
ncbi:MAG: CBS domain-containing protein [Candidatus Omnitrophica bacterium]|nr:CBS domain-containing protein [Candidatus Omnitrophota bacterium]